jgi:hypothetical protein
MFHVVRRELEQKSQKVLRAAVKESSQNSFGITYIGGSVALEGAVMDLHISTGIGINSSALKVSCGAPKGHREISENFREQKS